MCFSSFTSPFLSCGSGFIHFALQLWAGILDFSSHPEQGDLQSPRLLREVHWGKPSWKKSCGKGTGGEIWVVFNVRGLGRLNTALTQFC